MTTRRNAARELVDLGLTLAGEAVSRTLNALVPSNTERRARTYLTTLAPTVDNGFSPADIQTMMNPDNPLLPSASEELVSDIACADVDYIPRVRNGHLIMAAPTSAPPAGEPTGAGSSPSGTGEAPAERATSALLYAAANQLEKARHATGSIGYLYLGELIPELRERAAMFEKIENEETEA